MTQTGSGRWWRFSVAVLACIVLLVVLASAAGPAPSGTVAEKFEPGQNPGQHPDKATPVVPTTMMTPAVPAVVTVTVTVMVPVTAQTTASSSAFSDPSVLAAGIGLVSAGVGAGATLYTHAKK